MQLHPRPRRQQLAESRRHGDPRRSPRHNPHVEVWLGDWRSRAPAREGALSTCSELSRVAPCTRLSFSSISSIRPVRSSRSEALRSGARLPARFAQRLEKGLWLRPT